MLTVATLLWQPNENSLSFSRAYDETWVEKLYRGFRRNLTVPFRFVVFTDRAYSFNAPEIETHLLRDPKPSYATCIEPYGLDEPMILVGLDTVITGNCDHLAEYCMTGDTIALPRDPYRPAQACNGVALVPAGNADVYRRHNGENDMEWMRKQPHRFIDDIFPGHVVSYKAKAKAGLGDARIVYFHGKEKPNELPNVDWIVKNWRSRRALAIGGGAQGRADIEAALSMAEFDGVVACNDVGMTWAGKLDAWVSLHPDKFVQWTEGRKVNGHSPADRHFACTSARTGPTYTIKTPAMFEGQSHSGSSGLFAVKVALIDLGFDKAVCCGIPMDRESAHYFTPHSQWEGAVSHRKGWVQAMDHLRGRVRSMSGWTAKELGTPDPAWLHA